MVPVVFLLLSSRQRIEVLKIFSALDITVKSNIMKYLFDIDGIAYEIELSNVETKQLEYKKGHFAKVTLRQISQEPTTTDVGSALLRIEFDNGNVWHSKDAVIPKIIHTK